MTTSPAAPDLDVLPIDHDDIQIVYVSGGMTGYPEFNYPAFRKVAHLWRTVGYTVYDPTERIAECGTALDTSSMNGTERLPKDVFDLRKAFAEYAAFITLEADAVAVLPGWERSKGAVGEVMLGRSIGLPILDAHTGEFLDVEAVEIHLASTAVDASVDRHPAHGTETTAETLARTARPSLHAVAPAAAPSSSGEIRTVSASGGAKGVKEAQFSLIPLGPLKELAVLYGRGNIKYPPEAGEMANWMRGYEWSKSYDALLRHLALWWSREEDYDPEMGVKHLINVAWHAFNLAWFMENRPEFDDRPPRNENGEGLVYVGALPTPQFLLDLLEQRARAAQAEQERNLDAAAHQTDTDDQA